jgi:hypothetical protein
VRTPTLLFAAAVGSLLFVDETTRAVPVKGP